MNWDKLEFTNHERYFEIAREHLQKSQETDFDLNEKLGVNSSTYQGKSLKPEDAAYLLQSLQLINKSNIITVVFSALVAESFINYYAISKGKDEVYLRKFKTNKNLGLGETVVKWINIPHDINGNFALTTDSAEVHNLQKLFDDRNKLAHHKASIQNIASLDWSNIQDPNSITLLAAQNANQSLVTCIEALKRVDQSIDINWLSS
ncbi:MULTISPECIES: hypothetical protein [unclassified Nostoc]|uniref:hypothetical protein n=1 Tax=unclassified Nostoc TaxID=2593658 RepID=UPI0013D11BD6|nr:MULTISPECIES: hypothetical protein [unclassified Nostoc]MBE8997716.1 hypothetical protein [Nostoc sp. LEGE 12447]NEU80765.1 hypothetical protein [Nostoc sp. UIC 10630]